MSTATDAKEYAITSAYDYIMEELDQLAELWLEHRAARKDTDQVAKAISQAIRESRRIERRARRQGVEL